MSSKVGKSSSPCHSEGATPREYTTEKEIFSHMLIKTPATKESPVHAYKIFFLT
jgi:hypothetical protein